MPAEFMALRTRPKGSAHGIAFVTFKVDRRSTEKLLQFPPRFYRLHDPWCIFALGAPLIRRSKGIARWTRTRKNGKFIERAICRLGDDGSDQECVLTKLHKVFLLAFLFKLIIGIPRDFFLRLLERIHWGMKASLDHSERLLKNRLLSGLL